MNRRAFVRAEALQKGLKKISLNKQTAYKIKGQKPFYHILYVFIPYTNHKLSVHDIIAQNTTESISI
jgi:hypothetical protein